MATMRPPKQTPPPLLSGVPYTPGPWTVAVPNFHPARLNELVGNRWKAARLKKRDREVIGLYCLRAAVPLAVRKRRVGLLVVLRAGQRGPDVDAFWKSTLDALSACGAIVDDNRQGVELEPVRYGRSERAETVITLEDINE